MAVCLLRGGSNASTRPGGFAASSVGGNAYNDEDKNELLVVSGQQILITIIRRDAMSILGSFKEQKIIQLELLNLSTSEGFVSFAGSKSSQIICQKETPPISLPGGSLKPGRLLNALPVPL